MKESAIKILVIVLAGSVPKAGTEINVLHQCAGKINADGMVNAWHHTNVDVQENILGSSKCTKLV